MAWVVGVATAVMGSLWAAVAGAAPPAPALFGGQPLDFERTSGKVVGIYMPNWEPVALVDGLRANSATHVLYAFLRICGPGQLAKDAPRCEGKADFELATGPVDKTFSEAFTRLKARASHLKVLASVGGWGGSDPFFHLANDAARRERFAASAAAFLRTHPGFDGIDIDWEHPTSNGSANGVALGAPADGQGYAALMHALRKALDTLSAETGRPYLVTTAINTSAALVTKIDYRAAVPALDLVFMMTYDFYGPWTATAGHHSALFSPDKGGDDSLASGVRTMLKAGVPASKLVAGVAMYGRGFTGVVPPAPGARFNGAKRDGVYEGADGSMPYREIAARYLDARGQAQHGYQLVHDPQAEAYALWNPRSRLYMGYDDPRGVLLKARYAAAQGLAGVFAWEYSQDNGDLLNAMNLGVGHLPLRP